MDIEKGIPIPEPRSKANGVTEAMRHMEIGDSVVVPMKSRTNMKNFAFRVGIEVVTRKINDTEARVWRVK